MIDPQIEILSHRLAELCLLIEGDRKDVYAEWRIVLTALGVHPRVEVVLRALLPDSDEDGEQLPTESEKALPLFGFPFREYSTALEAVGALESAIECHRHRTRPDMTVHPELPYWERMEKVRAQNREHARHAKELR